jgi:hypothetical protein
LIVNGRRGFGVRLVKCRNGRVVDQRGQTRTNSLLFALLDTKNMGVVRIKHRNGKSLPTWSKRATSWSRETRCVGSAAANGVGAGIKVAEDKLGTEVKAACPELLRSR